MLFLKQPLILSFLCHESGSTCRIDSTKISNFGLKLELCNCVKIEVIEYIAPPQQPHKRDTIFLGHPVVLEFLKSLVIFLLVSYTLKLTFGPKTSRQKNFGQKSFGSFFRNFGQIRH